MHAATKAFILKSSPVEMTEGNSIREATTRRLRKNRQVPIGEPKLHVAAGGPPNVSTA
jgi:hypothetical protein